MSKGRGFREDRPGGRPTRGPPRVQAPRRAEQRPTPFPDGKCNPLCPYFKCLNNALVVVRKAVHGRMQRTPMCRWIGDQCIGGTCQYASCALKALLPDGSCLQAKERAAKKVEEVEKEIEHELVREEKEMGRIEKLMKRRGYMVDEDLL